MSGGKINLTFRDLAAHKAKESEASAKASETRKAGYRSSVSTATPAASYQGSIAKITIGKSNLRVVGTTADELGRNAQVAFSEITDNFKWYVDQLEGYLPQDLASALEPTKELAEYYCPKDTGALVESSYLAVEKYRGGCRVEFGFARGGIPDYAIYVHEMPFRHESPTCDKYMQRAIDEDHYNIIQRVTQNLKARAGAV